MQSINVQSPQSQKSKAKPPTSSKCQLKFDYAPSADGIDYNLLVLFHGLGDSKGPFSKLATKLNLPQTATLAVQAPEPVPLLEGCYQWHPSFDFLTGDLLTPANPERLKGLTRTRKLVTELLEHLTNDCGFEASRIFLFGFSQGGTVALDVALSGSIRNLGGVVSISGYLLEEQRFEKKIGNGYGGYILVTQGEKDQVIGNRSQAEKKFQEIQRLCSADALTSQIFISNKDHSMANSAAEWRILHTFFAERMPRRNLQLENMSDVYLVNP
ncbi:Alpha/Beta hydrolase protein [Zychaea mexicana]|uniref:Alpha/Beta hydrolase protein n=1 Tax=Zychaea mexicana TaxID=64656 RepID=UPI0022FF205A|nr:Alpha/Beta hydrolase protein [Zychaea mexicana]KAI9492336.1 Alpha/Beta hydrolase protein [Zychaea mexicana]